MVLGWWRAIYVEFVRRADVATFMGCHLRAFEYFGSVPRRCLYDNARVRIAEKLGRLPNGLRGSGTRSKAFISLDP